MKPVITKIRPLNPKVRARAVGVWYEESYPATSIAASLRKMAADSRAASSDNGRGQKVYWITDYGKECAKDYE